VTPQTACLQGAACNTTGYHNSSDGKSDPRTSLPDSDQKEKKKKEEKSKDSPFFQTAKPGIPRFSDRGNYFILPAVMSAMASSTTTTTTVATAAEQQARQPGVTRTSHVVTEDTLNGTLHNPALLSFQPGDDADDADDREKQVRPEHPIYGTTLYVGDGSIDTVYGVFQVLTFQDLIHKVSGRLRWSVLMLFIIGLHPCARQGRPVAH